MAAPQIRYPNSVFGYSANDPVDVGDVVAFVVVSTVAISKGKLVSIDAATRKVITTTAAVVNPTCIGVAGEDGAVGDVIPVTTSGFVDARSNTVITAGDRVGPDATTAGNVATVTAATAVTQAKDVGNVVGISADTVTAVASTIRIFFQKV